MPVLLELTQNGSTELSDALAAVTCKPADLLGLDAGRLQEGMPADLALIDLGTPWIFDAATLKSKSRNTPFDERKFQGRVVKTLVNGMVVFDRDS